ncbi:pyocin knob domain-containing protein [Testudinibacter sp. P80/BLE/0925]
MKQPKLLSKAWAETGLKNDVPATRTDSIPQESATYADGFPSITMTPIAMGGKAPSGKDMNGVLGDLSSHAVYQSMGGFYRFDTAFAKQINGYPKGAILASDNFKSIFVSLIDGNTTNFNSVAYVGKWEKVADIDTLKTTAPLKISTKTKNTTTAAGHTHEIELDAAKPTVSGIMKDHGFADAQYSKEELGYTTTDFNAIYGKTALMTIGGTMINGFRGGSVAYTGILHTIKRKWIAGLSLVQHAYDAGRFAMRFGGQVSETAAPVWQNWQEPLMMDALTQEIQRDVKIGKNKTLTVDGRVVNRRNQSGNIPHYLFIDDSVDLSKDVARKTIGQIYFRAGETGLQDGRTKAHIRSDILDDKNGFIEAGVYNSNNQFSGALRGFGKTGNFTIMLANDNGLDKLQVGGTLGILANGKTARFGVGNSDAYWYNEAANKYLQFKNGGWIALSDDPVLLSRQLGNTDLNTLTQPQHHGIFGQPINAPATTARGYPKQEAGSLLVLPSAYGVQQIYSAYYSKSVYKRNMTSSGGWSEWIDITATAWSEVTGKPATFAPSSHSHPWSQVTGAPATATRWPAWGEVTGKPVQATRWPTWAEITNKPNQNQSVTIWSGDTRAALSVNVDINKYATIYVLLEIKNATFGGVKFWVSFPTRNANDTYVGQLDAGGENADKPHASLIKIGTNGNSFTLTPVDNWAWRERKPYIKSVVAI